jgi:hypothetical protein
MEFVEFPKIPRLNREVIVTEKIDGTNASVCITAHPADQAFVHPKATAMVFADSMVYALYAGSRTRWITPQDDNFGFAGWVLENANELVKLDVGHHFGEWWGRGIQRGYGLTERRWSLFNTSRWASERPACCDVVPTLWRGPFRSGMLDMVEANLRTDGSVAAPGFMKPEGYVVFHTAANSGFKVTLERDEEWKGKGRAA